MRLILKTQLTGNYQKIYSGFDLKLFEFLKPKFGKSEVVEFTGSKKGDFVHIRFISPIKAEWISDIVKDEITSERAYFIDQGRILPWPLKSWQHKHIVINSGIEKSEIIDDIEYSTGNKILNVLFWPIMFMAFYPRKKLYKKYFKN